MEIPGRVGDYKMFLSAVSLGGREYFERMPFAINGDELLALLQQTLFHFRLLREPLPIIFGFYNPLKREGPARKEPFALSAPEGTRTVFLKADTKLVKSGNFKFVPIAYFRERWAEIIRDSEGSHVGYDATLAVPQEGVQYNVGIQYIYPAQANWHPYVCIMPASIQHFYAPLLRHKRNSGQLRRARVHRSQSILHDAIFGLWDSLRDL